MGLISNKPFPNMYIIIIIIIIIIINNNNNNNNNNNRPLRLSVCSLWSMASCIMPGTPYTYDQHKRTASSPHCRSVIAYRSLHNVCVVVLVSVPEAKMWRETASCGSIGFLEETQMPLADSVTCVAQGRQVLGQKDFRQGQSPGFWFQDQVLLHACRQNGNPLSTVTAVTRRSMIRNLVTKTLGGLLW